MNIRTFVFAAAVLGVGAFSGLAYAQDSNVGDTSERAQRLGFLSADDRQHLLRARREALQSDPDLKAEGESLKKELQMVKGKGTAATAEDKSTLRNNFLAHREKMNAAMVKADPIVQPILDQIQAHAKQRFQQGSDAPDDSANS